MVGWGPKGNQLGLGLGSGSGLGWGTKGNRPSAIPRALPLTCAGGGGKDAGDSSRRLRAAIMAREAKRVMAKQFATLKDSGYTRDPADTCHEYKALHATRPTLPRTFDDTSCDPPAAITGGCVRRGCTWEGEVLRRVHYGTTHRGG